MDPSFPTRYALWARGGAKGWTSFNQQLGKALRIPQEDYDRLIKVPTIPAAVGGMLLHPPSGPPKATQPSQGALKLSDPLSQHREETLKAIDRATREAFKSQALAQWTVEAVAETLRGTPKETEVRPLLTALSELSDVTVDQLSRASVRISSERRHNLLPHLGLSAATVSDLNRLPLEGPDLFAGHFEHVLARQATYQDTLRRNLRLASKAPPRQPRKRPAQAPSAKAPRRKKKPAASSRPSAAASRPPSSEPSVSVTLASGGRRVTSYATKRRGGGKRV